MAHSPDGGIVSIVVNGRPVKFDGKETLDLYQPDRQVLKNHFSESLTLIRGNNEIIFVSGNKTKDQKIGIDFFWFKEN